MSSLTEVGAYLEAETVGTVGTDLFLGQLRADPDTCMAVVQYPGRGPEFRMGIEGAAMEFPRFQFLSRSSSESTAEANAEAAMTAIAKVSNQTLSGTFYAALTPMQSPGALRRDEQDRVIFSFNFEAEKERS